MRRSEVEQWLQDHKGQKDYRVTQVEVPNPAWSVKADINVPKTIKVPQVTWIANDGQRLTVTDQSQIPGADPNKHIADDPQGGKRYDPDYEVIASGDDAADDPKDNRTPEQKANDAELDRQRRKNSDPNIPDPRWETDAEREKRANDTIATQRQQGIDAQNAAKEAAAQQLANDRFNFDKDRDQKDRDRQAALDADQREERNRIREKDARDEDARQRAEARSNSVVGPISEDQENIARWNPETGQLETVENPIYNRIKAEAARKEKELATAIQLRKMNAEEAATEYKRWYDENISTPILQATERRAQSAEQRQALQMKEQQRQFASTQEMDKAKLGQSGANMMLDAEMALNPYRVGPEFGEQMSSAINGLAAGGKLDGPAANAGVNFTSKAFEYKKPDLDAIARKGAANAVKGLTPYKPGDEPIPTADYTGINMPSATTMQGAPSLTPTGGPDPNSIFQQLYGKPYQFNAQSTRA